MNRFLALLVSLCFVALGAVPPPTQPTMRTFNTIADMVAALPTVFGTNAIVLGYSSSGDGGGGIFWSQPELVTTTTNTSTIFRSTSNTNFLWYRNILGPINSVWSNPYVYGTTSNSWNYVQTNDQANARPVQQGIYETLTLGIPVAIPTDFHQVDMAASISGASDQNVNFYGFESKVQNYSTNMHQLVGALFEANQTVSGYTDHALASKVENQLTASGAIQNYSVGLQIADPTVVAGAIITNYFGIELNNNTSLDNAGLITGYWGIYAQPPAINGGGIYRDYQTFGIASGNYPATNENVGIKIGNFTGNSAQNNYGILVGTVAGAAGNNYSIYTAGNNNFAALSKFGSASGTPVTVFGGNNSVSIVTPANTGGQAIQIVDGTRGASIGVSTTMGAVMGSYNNYPTTIQMNGTPVIAIDTSSNVVVNGLIEGNIYSTGSNNFSGLITLGSASGTPLTVYGGNNSVLINSTTSSQGRNLQLVDGTRGAFIGVSTSYGAVMGGYTQHPVAIEQNGNPIITIDTNGNTFVSGALTVQNGAAITNTGANLFTGANVFGSGSGTPISISGGAIPLNVTATPSSAGKTIQFQDGSKGGYIGVSSSDGVRIGSYTSHPVSININGANQAMIIDASYNTTFPLGTVSVSGGVGSTAIATGSPTATGWTNSTSVNYVMYVTAATSAALLDNAGNTEFSGVTIAAFTPIRIQPGGKFTGTGITYATGAGAHAW